MKKDRKLIYHRDLGTLECLETPIDFNDYLWDYIGRIAGTQVDTFVLHMTYNLCPSKLKREEFVSETGDPVGLVGDHATWAAKGITTSSWRVLENEKSFREHNVDPVEMMIDAAHENGTEFFAGVRMNDVHHAQYTWHPKFWMDHPEYRIGDHPEYHWPRAGFWEQGGTFQSQTDSRPPACLNFLYDEVREYKLAHIVEIMEQYDVDGIELDFTRHPFFFKPDEIQKGTDRMTEFLSTLRERARSIENTRKKPVVIELRVPPTLHSCMRIGLDVSSWIRKDVADIVAVAPYWHPDFNLPVEEFLDIARDTSCKIFASIEFAEMPVLASAVETAEVVRGAASAYWAAGVAGIHLFNMHVMSYYLRQEMPFLREIGDPDTLRFLNKRYLATRSSNFDNIAWSSYPKQIPAVLKETRSGESAVVSIRLGDESFKAPKFGIALQASLHLRLLNLTSRDEIEFRLNGRLLDRRNSRSRFFPMGEAGSLRQYSFLGENYYGVEGPYHWLEFPILDLNILKSGENEVAVRLVKRNPEVSDDIILNDVEMRISQEEREGAHVIA